MKPCPRHLVLMTAQTKAKIKNDIDALNAKTSSVAEQLPTETHTLKHQNLNIVYLNKNIKYHNNIHF